MKDFEKLTEFEQEVIGSLKNIPRGKVTTYKLLALALKRPRSARAVGRALNKNPILIKFPCHRVVRSDGMVGGYRQGTAKKVKLLKNEGIKFSKNRIIDFDKVLYEFK